MRNRFFTSTEKINKCCYDRFRFIIILLFTIISACTINSTEKQFKKPPRQFKPMPFWHINGELTTEGIRQQMKDANDVGFTGISLLPLASGEKRVGTTPEFLTEEYFDRYQDVLDVAEELKMEIILYDDNDFPSGMAGGKLEQQFPDHTMKRLDKAEVEIKGPATFIDTINAVQLMAAVAMNTKTLDRIEISNSAENGVLKWEVPSGNWKIMLFKLQKDSFHKKYLCVDFMDTVAVNHLISLTYDEYARRFGSYFGNTIKMTFFDDVGFWRHPASWTGKFNEKFEEMHGFDPRPWYPALWYNIGPDTEAVRNCFFNTRAELLSEGHPKMVAQWNEKHGLKSTGHPPGNYNATPIDMNADIFKFYRYTQVPLTDAIISYQDGQNGHKLISSAADFYDRPVVAAEIYGAFRENLFDSLILYRSLFEMMVRGVNFVIPHGMWYNPDQVYIPPLVSPYSEKLAAALPAYSEFVGRSCMLLQGGRRVAEIGVMYPFEELAAYFCFDNPDKIRQGFYISPETDYQKIGSLLTNDIRYDFTFVHPEFFIEDKYSIDDGRVNLQNHENYQEYRVLFLTGCNIISYKTLEKVKAFYESGGTVISTTQLPFKSAEVGHDQKVVKLVEELFNINPYALDSSRIQENSNSNGGYAAFIPNPDKENIHLILEKKMLPDVTFSPNPELASDYGKFSYIHKVKDEREIYYFANSSDETIKTQVYVRGHQNLQKWNPHNGNIDKDIKPEYLQLSGENYTRFALTLEPVRSIFYLGKNQ
jgi:hypothetical protein